MPELLIIMLIVVVLFGASRLPALGAGLGQGLRSFKKAFGGEDEKPQPPTTTDQTPKS